MSQRTLLDRAAILAAPDITTEDVDIPEWGGTVRVRGLTASQRDQFESESLKGKGGNVSMNLLNIRARLVALSVVDDDNNPLFTDRDVHVLGGKSASAVDRIFDVATRLSGIGASDVEDLAKNLESSPNDDSDSA